MKKAKVVVFPGSNCDADCQRALTSVGFQTERIWHRDASFEKCDLIVIPGGFSFGDYLRAGAIAKSSPIMNEVVRHSQRGALVLGICNGFQILLELGLLPGAMTKNESLRFICKPQNIKRESVSPFSDFDKQILNIPIAHGEGNFRIDNDGLKRIQDNEQIVFRYCDEVGNVGKPDNPNGSIDNIAALCSENRRVLGMMPHPERACDAALGSEDGAEIFRSILSGPLK